MCSPDGVSPGSGSSACGNGREASERIKRLRGNPDAVASAYSLDDYVIAAGPRWRGRLRRPARPCLDARDPTGQRHGPEPHGHRFALGHRASRMVPVTARAALPGLWLRRARPVARSAGRDLPRGPLLGRHATPPSCSSGSIGRPVTSATSITATTARASRGTTPPSSTSSIRRSARRSSRRSSMSPGASRSSASTPRWSLPRSTSSGCGGPSPGPPAASRHGPSTPSRRPSSTSGCRSSSGARSSTGSRPRCPARSCSPRRSGCSRATSSGRSGCIASTTARSCTCSATRTARAIGRSSRRPSSSTPRSSSATSTS